LNQYEGYFRLFDFEYPKYGGVSNQKKYNMLWLELEAIFADISYEKPNITPLAIN